MAGAHHEFDTTQGHIVQYFSYIMNRISNKHILYIYILYCTRAGFYAKKRHWLNVTISLSSLHLPWFFFLKPCHPGSPCWPVGSSVVLAPPRWMNIGSTSKKTPPWNGASNRWRWRTELADHGFRWIDVDLYWINTGLIWINDEYGLIWISMDLHNSQ